MYKSTLGVAILLLAVVGFTGILLTSCEDEMELPQYPVYFHGDEGSVVFEIDAIRGTKISEPSPPIKTGYEFAGWYRDTNLTSKWDFKRDRVSSELRLFAKWIEILSLPLKYVEGREFQIGKLYTGDYPLVRAKVNDFCIGQYEVTQDIYQEVTGVNPSYHMGARLPVENVSWYDAVLFCNLLSRRDGYEEVYSINGMDVTCDWGKMGYRLPTDAEWEYAAVGGVRNIPSKYAGSNNANDVAWYSDNSAGISHEVGLKMSNELNLFDMSGNVWEYAWDWYDLGYYRDDPVLNPNGPSTGTVRVIRGGCYLNADWVTSIKEILYTDPTRKTNHIGFRVVLPIK